ncbi:hypothetical protein, partial [Salidesulfovibrio brasiliensis]|uniref:hypothetical protein n=1 Tax=Salidesulfovibrio brasiliensis TaxID=221711 RepID=UPI001C4560BE
LPGTIPESHFRVNYAKEGYLLTSILRAKETHQENISKIILSQSDKRARPTYSIPTQTCIQ